MSKRTLKGIFLSRIEKTMHPDLSCDGCAQQFKVKLESDTKWEKFIVDKPESENRFKHIPVLCPELIKVVVEYNNRILCPRCKEGLLLITEESQFHIPTLLELINDI